MAKISIILPTRNRQSSVYRLLDSISRTTDNPQDLEIILYTDEDDLESRSISYNTLTLIKLTGPSKPMGAITNICYKASTGRYVFLMNDDVVFQTPHWDTTVLMTFEKFPDGIV
ncbi:MAG: glycosyltransferase, partial [Planctomycetes bacterium]|nr:glycosyltransferase [Planctomycetota bacterium]